MAYTQIYYHIVWRTKNSRRSLTEQYEIELYKYIWGIVSDTKSKLYRINSMPDHVHMLIGLSPTISLSDFMLKVKTSSNHFIKSHPEWFPYFEGWGKSCCAITYSTAEFEVVKSYVTGQKEHHRRVSFADELSAILKEAGVDYVPKYFLTE